ncbi:unnamed protein product, partial [Staurois parvus]
MMGHYSSHIDTTDGAPSLVSVGGIVSHHWCQWGIVPHHWCQSEESCPIPIIGVSGEESCPIISVSGRIAPHHWNTILKYHTILKSNLM